VQSDLKWNVEVERQGFTREGQAERKGRMSFHTAQLRLGRGIALYEFQPLHCHPRESPPAFCHNSISSGFHLAPAAMA
jgi:hypothetical protein